VAVPVAVPVADPVADPVVDPADPVANPAADLARITARGRVFIRDKTATGGPPPREPAAPGAGRPYGRRRSVALATLATMAASGGMTRATADMMTAASTEYRSTTAQDTTNSAMQTPISTK